MLCVRERHEPGGEVVNELVAVATDGGGARAIVVATTSSPRRAISPDGSRLAWLAWDHPRMPWDGTELWVGDLAADGIVRAPPGGRRRGDESIFQPGWSPAGELHFVSDRTGWWNLYRQRDGADEALCPVRPSSAGRSGCSG